MNGSPLPKQLRNLDYRFFLVGKGRKIPIEKKWNTNNCYMFFEKKLLNHISNGGNVGVCTGYGNLIVIDFDSADYQEAKINSLPRTFTTKTAGKGLYHLYYTLKGEMISKIAIGLEPRLCDIQAGKDGVVCPPSNIKGRFYIVEREFPIAEIDCATLSRVFGIQRYRQSRRRKFNREVMPEKIQESIDILLKVGVERTNKRHFKCPFHKMYGGGNMYVFDDGSIHCFHCLKHFNSADDFKKRWEYINNIKLK